MLNTTGMTAMTYPASGASPVRPFTPSDGTGIGVTWMVAPSMTTELRQPLRAVVASVASGSDAVKCYLSVWSTKCAASRESSNSVAI